MEHVEIVFFGLLVAVAGLVLVANLLDVPYPILLVIGGLAIGFIPGMPEIELAPELVLVIFLPPLLYVSAFFSSLRDLRANIRPIGLLAIGLVALTAVAVAGVAHWVIGLSWPVAFVLGGILSPTDPVAATAIAQKLGVPRRIVTILEGESLVNDASALVLFRVALGVVTAEAAFTFLNLGYRFTVGIVVGVGIGLLVGWIVTAIRRRVEDPLVEITITLVTGYAAYLPAEELNNSGILPASAVLAAVTAGIYIGWRNPSLTSPRTRLQSFSVWETVTFLLNSLLFILVGLQLPTILANLSDENLSYGTLALYGALVSLVVILARFVWVFPATYGPRYFSRSTRERDPYPPWRNVVVVSYAGMRGAVSLAAALSIPETLPGTETPFPGRDLILFLTFCVILVTVVGQGLTLRPLIRWLDIHDDGASEREEIKSRLVAAEAALERIEELKEEGWVREDTAERMRGLYSYRRRRFAARHTGVGEDEEDLEERSSDFQRFRRELLEAERAAILRLRSEGKIGDEAMRTVERDLDLEDARLEI